MSPSRMPTRTRSARVSERALEQGRLARARRRHEVDRRARPRARRSWRLRVGDAVVLGEDVLEHRDARRRRCRCSRCGRRRRGGRIVVVVVVRRARARCRRRADGSGPSPATVPPSRSARGLPLEMRAEAAIPQAIEGLDRHCVEAKVEHVSERAEPVGTVGERLIGRAALTDSAERQAPHDVDAGRVAALNRAGAHEPRLGRGGQARDCAPRSRPWSRHSCASSCRGTCPWSRG